MLSMSAIKASPTVAANYYVKGDYYAKGDDEPSAWTGSGAAALGLEGGVEAGAFKAILEGTLPSGHRAGWDKSNMEHRPGWDLTFNAPKSLSILATLGDDKRLVDAHMAAVEEALKFVETYAHVRERNGDGTITHKATGNIVAAQFTEFFSRALDPHLHTHCPVANMTYDEDRGAWYALESHPLFKMKMAAGQVYRSALALMVKDLGYEIESAADTGLFEIKGIPEALTSAFSSRREEIEEYAKEHGWSSAAEYAIATLLTRPDKAVTDHETVLEDLDERAGAHMQDIYKLIDRSLVRSKDDSFKEPTDPHAVIDAARHGLYHLSNREAVFEHGHVLLEALKVSVGFASLEHIETALKDGNGNEAYHTTEHQTGGKQLYHGRTIERSIGWELSLADKLLEHRDVVRPLASPQSIERAQQRHSLTQEQAHAADYVLRTRDRIVSVVGVAGAGKSHLVKSIKAATPSRDHLAIAPTSTAAIDLGRDVAIKSQTLTGFLQTGGHHVTRNSVLFVDEASMTNTRQASRLMDIAKHKKARIVLIGDTKQAEAIEQGKPFSMLVKQGLRGPFILKSFRQKNASMRELVDTLRRGDVASTLNKLGERLVAHDSEALPAKVAEEWINHKRRDSVQIAALDNASRIALNAEIRNRLQREGVVKSDDAKFNILSSKALTPHQLRYADYYKRGNVLVFHVGNKALGIKRDSQWTVTKTKGDFVSLRAKASDATLTLNVKQGRKDGMTLYEEQDRKLAAGDKIQWRQNMSQDDMIKNGHTGTIEKIKGNRAAIAFDHGIKRNIDLEKHPFWDHGYALTVYKQQGKTTPVNWVIANTRKAGEITQTALYVALTRAQRSVKVFTEDKDKFERAVRLNPGGKTSAVEGRGHEVNRHAPVAKHLPSTIELLADKLSDRLRSGILNFLDWQDERAREKERSGGRDPRIVETIKHHTSDTAKSREISEKNAAETASKEAAKIAARDTARASDREASR
jgi:conjugative relaxase-like TrwC/TraI family protein